MQKIPETNEEEIRELFEKLSVEVPGTNGLRAMNLQAFKLGVDKMMNQAFVEGSQNSLKTAEDIINRVFNK
jgi:hypothetical protein